MAKANLFRERSAKADFVRGILDRSLMVFNMKEGEGIFHLALADFQLTLGIENLTLTICREFIAKIRESVAKDPRKLRERSRSLRPGLARKRLLRGFCECL